MLGPNTRRFLCLSARGRIGLSVKAVATFRSHHDYHQHHQRQHQLLCDGMSRSRSNTHQQHQKQTHRNFARSSAPCDETPFQKAVTFVMHVGYSPEIAHGVVDALRQSGLSGEALLSSVRQMAGRWEVGDDEGLEPLAASVEEHLKQRTGKKTITIHIIPPNAWHSGLEDGKDENDIETSGTYDGSSIEGKETEHEKENMMKRAFQVEAMEGTSLTDIAKFGSLKGASTLGEYMECACSGIMACSTCHVVIEPGKWYEKVGAPCEDEQDMIDLAYNPKTTSRLGCKVVLTKDLDGLIVRLPKGSYNLMDYIPFED